jgi:hypothetical protein
MQYTHPEWHLLWGDVTLLFDVPGPIAEQALVDMYAVVHEVSAPATPEAMCIIFIGAVLLPIHEVIEPCIKHGLGNVQGHRGIMKDAWLKAAEGISAGQCMQRVVLLPLGVMILLLEIGQLLCHVSNSIVCASEALYFRTEGFIMLLVDGKVNHRSEGLPWIEHVRLLLGEDPSQVQVFSCPERAQML